MNDDKSLVIRKKRFAEGYYNFYKLVILFAIGCFIGDIYEVALHYIKNGEIVARRGVIYGPFNPVYGFGLILMVLLLGKVKKTWKMFVFGATIGGTFEYVCSLIQEKVYGTYAWDYSHLPLNIGGRTTIPYALFWGLLAIVVMRVIVPKMSYAIEKLPVGFGKVATCLLAVFLVWDMSISSLAVQREYSRQMNIEAKNVFDEYLDKHYPSELIRKVYANSKYVDEDLEQNAFIQDALK